MSKVVKKCTSPFVLVGDFTASLAEAYDDVSDAKNNFFSKGDLYETDNGSIVYQGRNGSYSLLSDNCFDRTFATFALGTLEDGVNASMYVYAYNITDFGISYPNDNIPLFKKAFGNDSFTYEGAYDSAVSKIGKYVNNKEFALPGQINYFSSFVK